MTVEALQRQLQRFRRQRRQLAQLLRMCRIIFGSLAPDSCRAEQQPAVLLRLWLWPAAWLRLSPLWRLWRLLHLAAAPGDSSFHSICNAVKSAQLHIITQRLVQGVSRWKLCCCCDRQ